MAKLFKGNPSRRILFKGNSSRRVGLAYKDIEVSNDFAVQVNNFHFLAWYTVTMFLCMIFMCMVSTYWLGIPTWLESFIVLLSAVIQTKSQEGGTL